MDVVKAQHAKNLILFPTWQNHGITRTDKLYCNNYFLETRHNDKTDSNCRAMAADII